MKNNILIVGDAMLDSHVTGDVERISPEAPVPVVRAYNKSHTLGGAANVAAQVSTFADKTLIMYKNIRGADEGEDDVLGDLLKERSIRRVRLWMNWPNAPSCIPIKQRVWAGQQQVCRIDQENTDLPNHQETEGWIDTILRVIDEEEITKVIFSDYDKGTLTDDIIERVAGVCHEKGVLTILDPKRPTFWEISFLDVVKANERELLSTGLGTVEHVSFHMRNTKVIQTRGGKTTLIGYQGDTFGAVETESTEVVDVCGAGDVHVAVFTLKFDGSNTLESVQAANRAAAQSVKHRGCYTLSREEVLQCLSVS